MACPLAAERVWTEKAQYNDAEKKYFETLSKLLKGSVASDTISAANAEPNSSMLTENTEFDDVSSNKEDKHQQNLAKSPMKKMRKQKKDKKDSSPPLAENELLQNATTSCGNVEGNAVITPKVKAKKDKNNKLKQLNKQNSNIAGTEEYKESFAASDIASEASSVTLDNCPFKAAIESVKVKKQRKRDKKSGGANNESSISDDLTSVKAMPAVVAGDKIETNKSMKDKKAKQEKRKLATAAEKVNKDDAQAGGECTLVSEIAKARQHIKNSLERMDGIAALASTPGKDVLERITILEKENSSLRDIVEQLKEASLRSEDRIKQLESRLQSLSLGGTVNTSQSKPAPVAAASKASDDDDGVDLFGSDSDEEDDAAAKVREARLAEYASKKSKKPTLIAKSNIILDVKPWDDETDMKQMEVEVRKIISDGLLWGAAKLVPLAFGIHKLQISCVVEDDKVSIDWLTEEIEKNEDFVQSVDIAAFNKI